MTSSVGRVVVDAIRAERTELAFCVPGESYLSVLDAFNDVDDVELVTTHHEEGACFMADAYAKATGRPGVVMVTRGPGVSHLAIALHAARQDSTPLVAVVGQVPTRNSGRESFQEVDLVALGGLLGKAGMEIRDPDRAAETMSRAFHVARSGRPGPVVVSLPEDVGLMDTERSIVDRPPLPVPAADPELVARAARSLAAADRVAIVAGGGVLVAGATDLLVEVANVLGCPVYAGWRRCDVFPADHPQFAGNLPWLPDDLTGPLVEADTVLALGTRLGDNTSLGYRVPRDGQTLVQVDVAAESMSVVRPPDVPIVADCGSALAMLLTELRAIADPGARDRRLPSATGLHQRYLDTTEPAANADGDGVVDIPPAIAAMRRILPDNAAVSCDAGAFSGYLHRYFRWTVPSTFFGTTSGAMGYAVPAAIGAKLADRTRAVVAVAGDGGFTMTMSEVHTAARLGLSGLVFVVFDNGTYGTIRQHQQRRYPGRVIGVDQGSADLAQVARGLGATATTVTSNAAFEQAVKDGLAAAGPAVVHAVTSPDQIAAWAE